jgi:hypothetical protein
MTKAFHIRPLYFWTFGYSQNLVSQSQHILHWEPWKSFYSVFLIQERRAEEGTDQFWSIRSACCWRVGGQRWSVVWLEQCLGAPASGPRPNLTMVASSTLSQVRRRLGRAEYSRTQVAGCGRRCWFGGGWPWRQRLACRRAAPGPCGPRASRGSAGKERGVLAMRTGMAGAPSTWPCRSRALRQ